MLSKLHVTISRFVASMGWMFMLVIFFSSKPDSLYGKLPIDKCTFQALDELKTPSERDSIALSWEYFKLKNDLQVILQPDLNNEEVVIEFWVSAGAKDEMPGMFGFAHFFEHATPYGLTSDTAKQKLFRSMRTSSNAQTRKDYTRYYVQIKPQAIELALRYTADRLKYDTTMISDAWTEMHKKNVLLEMQRQESKPLYGPTATSIREAATFGEHHPYGHSTYGSFDENKNFNTSDIRKWYAKFFYPENVILFVAGNFDINEIKSLIDQQFGGIKSKDYKILSKETRPYSSKGFRQKHTERIPIETNCLSITWKIPGYGSKTEPAFQVLAEIVDQRLAALDQSRWSKANSSNLYNAYGLAGQFGVYANFESLSDSTEIEKRLRTIIKDITSNISEDEVKRAKKRLDDTTVEMIKRLGFIGSRTELIGEGLLFKEDPGYYLIRLRKQRKLMAQDLQRIAKKWIAQGGSLTLLKSSKPPDK